MRNPDLPQQPPAPPAAAPAASSAEHEATQGSAPVLADYDRLPQFKSWPEARAALPTYAG